MTLPNTIPFGSKPLVTPTGSPTTLAFGSKPLQAITNVQPVQSTPVSLNDRLATSAQNRANNVVTSLTAQAQGKQGYPNTILQILGEGAGLLTDTAVDLAKQYTPQAIKDVFSQDVQNFNKTSQGSLGEIAAKNLGQKVSNFSQKNPVMARDLGAMGNVVGLAGGVEGIAKLGVGLASGVADTAGSIAKNVTAPFAKSYLPDTAEAFAKEGITPPVSAITKSPFIKGSEALASKGLYGEEINKGISTAKDAIAQKTETVVNSLKPQNPAEDLQALQNKTDEIISSVKPIKTLSDENLGKTIQDGLANYEANFKQTFEKIYKDFSVKNGSIPAITTQTQDVGEKVLAQQQADLFKGVDPRIQKMVAKISGEDNPLVISARNQNLPESIIQQIKSESPAQITFQNLRSTRTAIGEALAKDPTNAGLNQIYGALSEDQMATVNGVDPKAGANLKAIDNLYKTGKQTLESRISQSISTSNPEKIAQNLIQRNSADMLTQVKGMIGDQNFAEVSKVFTRQLFEGATKNGTFNIDNFVQSFNKYDQPTLDVLLNPEQQTVLKGAINELSQVEQSKNQIQFLQNLFDKSSVRGSVNVDKMKEVLAGYSQQQLDSILPASQQQQVADVVGKLEKYQQLSDSLKSGTKISDGSQTAFLQSQARVGGQIGSAFTALLLGHPEVAASIVGEIGLEKLGAKMFTSNIGRKFLTSGLLK